MKQVCVFLLLIMLTGCEYFNVKKTSSETILKEELKTFNWNEVDEYPTFSTCDSVISKQNKKHCFEQGLSTQIGIFLQNESIVVTQDINDTIDLEFQVSEKGILKLLSTKIDSLTIRQIPNIKTLLAKSLDSLPRIFPAIKRGQQVSTEFKLAIIITVD